MPPCPHPVGKGFPSCRDYLNCLINNSELSHCSPVVVLNADLTYENDTAGNVVSENFLIFKPLVAELLRVMEELLLIS